MTMLSWAHVDYFTRNIGTVVSGPLTTTAADELLASMRQANNADLWTWPTADDLRRLGELDGHPEISGTDSTNVTAVEAAVAGATSLIARLKDLPVLPVDENGDVDETADPPAIGADTFLATLLLANQLYRRSMAPDGGWGAADMISVDFELDPVVSMLLWEPPSL